MPSNAKSFRDIRGKELLSARILRNVFVRFRASCRSARGHAKPRVSALAHWPQGDHRASSPHSSRLPRELGVEEVYLQRLVYFAGYAIGKARPDQSLFERLTQR